MVTKEIKNYGRVRGSLCLCALSPYFGINFVYSIRTFLISTFDELGIKTNYFLLHSVVQSIT